jgi:hypothetical protein
MASQINSLGWRNVVGTDSHQAMIHRGKYTRTKGRVTGKQEKRRPGSLTWRRCSAPLFPARYAILKGEGPLGQIDNNAKKQRKQEHPEGKKNEEKNSLYIQRQGERLRHVLFR